MRLPGLVLPTGLLLAEAAMPSSLSGDLPAAPHCSPQGHIAKVAIAKTLLIYCLHSGGLRRPPLTRLWGGNITICMRTEYFPALEECHLP